MNHLVVIAHPRSDSFNMQLKELYVSCLERLQHDVRIRDLYALGFNPVATPRDLSAGRTGDYEDDVRAEQEHLLWSDVITFITPVWWMSFPAILKGYMDRVLVEGFAYAHGVGKQHVAGLIEDKRCMIISTSGSTLENFEESGKMAALALTQNKYTLEFCNIEVIERLHFGPVGSRLTDELAKRFFHEVESAVERHFADGYD